MWYFARLILSIHLCTLNGDSILYSIRACDAGMVGFDKYLINLGALFSRVKGDIPNTAASLPWKPFGFSVITNSTVVSCSGQYTRHGRVELSTGLRKHRYMSSSSFHLEMTPISARIANCLVGSDPLRRELLSLKNCPMRPGCTIGLIESILAGLYLESENNGGIRKWGFFSDSPPKKNKTIVVPKMLAQNHCNFNRRVCER